MNAFDAITMFIKLVLAIVLFFVFLPMLTLKNRGEATSLAKISPPDKMFTSFIHANLYFIVIVHLLAITKLYETISLFIISLIIFGWLIKYRDKTDSLSIGMKSLMLLFDFSESRESWKQELRKLASKWKTLLIEKIQWLYKGFLAHPITWIVLTIVISIGAYVRLTHAFEHLYFAASDPYVHLVWSKQLGKNLFYQDGVYPYGYEAIISVINKLTLIDSYYIIRFFGPLTGVLIMLSAIYVVGQKTRYHFLIVIMASVVYVSGLGFTENLWRQLSALSMEYGIIFFLPGLYYLTSYFETKDRQKMILAAECFMLAGFVHLYVVFCLGLAYIVISIVNIGKLIRWRSLWIYTVVMAAGGLLGLLPVFIGRLNGIPLHSAKNGIVNQSIKKLDFSKFFREWYLFREQGPAMIIFLACLVVWLLLIVFKIGKKTDIGFILVAFMLYVLYRANKLGLPYLIPDFRIGAMLMPVTVIAIIMPFYLISTLKFMQQVTFRMISSAVIIFATAASLYLWPLTIPKVREQYQYDEAVQAYLQIKENLPYLNWTIVGVEEELQLAYTYGQFVELWQFVDSISSTDKDKKLVIDTDYILIFTEKIPLNSKKQITEMDALKPFPEPTGNLTNLYYINKENRAMLQAKAYYWAENYMKTHSNMEIFLDTEYMRIYKINQPGKHSANLLK